MSRKKGKELPVIEDIEITGIAAEGNSITRHNDKVVFIPYGAPGDIVDVKIDRRRSSYSEGHIVNIKKPSPLRVTPFCVHFGTCGGCKWQHLPYSYQLEFKRQQVVDALTRIAKIPFPEVNPCLPSENQIRYRNKLEYTFSNKKWLTFEQLGSGLEFPDRDGAGFHIPGCFDKVLDIEECHLQEEFGNRLRLFIKDYAKRNGWSFYDLKGQNGFMRTLMIRTLDSGQKMAVMVFGENDKAKIDELMDAVSKEFPEITSLNYVVNLKVNDTITDQDVIPWNGSSPYIEEIMGELKFRIGPKSFYQTNSRQAHRLYATAERMANLKGDELVYDLYTGTGTIANFVANKCKRVIGIEYVPEAIEDARINSSINKIDNTEFFAGDMKDVLTDEFIARHGHPDVMIVDPPRAGMHADVVKVIKNTKPKRIVYVSCNPATQARDLADLYELYDIVEVQPVDMFPHTHHVENVVALTLRG